MFGLDISKLAGKMITPDVIKGLLLTTIEPQLQQNEMYSLLMSSDRKRVILFKCVFALSDDGKMAITHSTEVDIDQLIAKIKESIIGKSSMSEADKKELDEFQKKFEQ